MDPLRGVRLPRLRTSPHRLLRGVRYFPGRLWFVDNTQSEPLPLLARWTWWILPVLMFGAIALSVSLLRAWSSELPGLLMGAVALLGLAWVLVSSLHPARADRTCPECKEESLERLDPRTTRGVVCSRCGYTDHEVSSWCLAEEETVLEEIVMAERGRATGLEPRDLAQASTASAAPKTEITK